MSGSKFWGYSIKRIRAGDWKIPQDVLDKIGTRVANGLTTKYAIDPPLKYGEDVTVELDTMEGFEDYPETTVAEVTVRGRFGDEKMEPQIRTDIEILGRPYTITNRLEFLARVVGGNCIEEYRKHCEVTGIPFDLAV